MVRLPDENDLAVGGGGRRPGDALGRTVSKWAENFWREICLLSLQAPKCPSETMDRHGLLPVETASTITVTKRVLSAGPTIQQQKSPSRWPFHSSLFQPLKASQPLSPVSSCSQILLQPIQSCRCLIYSSPVFWTLKAKDLHSTPVTACLTRNSRSMRWRAPGGPRLYTTQLAPPSGTEVKMVIAWSCVLACLAK